MAINFERLVSRSVAVWLSREIDLAGLKISVNKLLEYVIVGGVAVLVIFAFALFFIGIPTIEAFLVGIGAAGFFVAFTYVYLEYLIDKRKSKMEEILPDYFQITSANLRSGVALDRAERRPVECICKETRYKK